jgi:Predicted Fe-S oxidoreductases
MKIRLDENGVHIFDRNNGTNILLDEVQGDQKNWARSPRHISFALTNRCDLSCEYCYAPKNRSEIEFDKLCKWIIELDKNGAIGVGFGGGEPTIYKRFVEICQFVSKHTQLSVSFTTHGHRISKFMAEQLRGHVNFIRVSMDGLGLTYERLRGKSFTNFISAISIIKTIAPFGINYVLNKDTIDELEEAISFSNVLGAKEFLILPELDKLGNTNKEILDKLKCFLEIYKGGMPLRINSNCSDGIPIANPFKDEFSLNGFAFVDASGFLKVTSYDTYGIDLKEINIIDGMDILRDRLKKIN